MSQVRTRKIRSRKTSLVMEGSPVTVEKQISEKNTVLKLTKSCISPQNMSESEFKEGEMNKEKKTLVIDDIIDNFELEDESKAMEEHDLVNSNNCVKHIEVMDEKEQDSDGIDDFEEEDEEVNDDEEYVQPYMNKVLKKSTAPIKQVDVKYGKLWEFIRDLLKNEKYNPKIITWEDIDKGEFRIVDSVLVAKLWATVKKNKKMNYEKLSRAMRYYYKQNIFGIVENKRLVYRFASKAKNWKPSGMVGETLASSPPDRRCYNCLRLLESGAALKRHSEVCNTNIIIPGNDNKNGIKVVEVEPRGNAQPEENKKRLSQKLNEIKAKEKEDEQYKKISKEFIRKMNTKDDGRGNTEACNPSPPKEDAPSIFEDIESKSNSEKEALETLMNLGSQSTPARTQTSSNLPVVEVPDSSSKITASNQAVPPPVFNQILANPLDKIQFLKSASEKSKTQTILQKRTENVSPVINCIPNSSFNLHQDKNYSDDEVEIVEVIKPVESDDRIEAAAETVVKNQRLATQKSIGAKNELPARSGPKIMINTGGKTLNVIQTNPAPSILQEGKLAGRGKSIKINPKYSNLIPKKINSGNVSSSVLMTPPVESQLSPSLNHSSPGTITPSSTGAEPVLRPTIVTSVKQSQLLTPPSTPTGVNVPQPSLVPTTPASPESESGSEPAKKLIRINPKYSNFVAGKKPEDCGNIAVDSSPADSTVRSSIKINPKYQTQRSSNVLSDKEPPPSYEVAVTEPVQPDKSPTLTTLLRNTKISDIRAMKGGDSEPVLPNVLKRRHSGTSSVPVADLGEPIPNLWRFIRALLHNPNYNPKLVAWEHLEEGIFRIHNLQDFYNVWKLMKSTTINYDLWVKTVKLYDEKRILHSLEGHRCVYKFGVKATEWKPRIGEVIVAGKRHFPNQATWPMSRFYSEFNPPPPPPVKPPSTDLNAGVTTLFTLRPLDTTVTSMSEMKVMSDNSSIVIPNDSRKNIIYSGPKSPAKRIKLTKLKDLSENKSENNGDPETPQKLEIPSAKSSIELDCKLTLSSSYEDKAVLKFPNGVTLQLERSLFSAVEKKIKDDHPDGGQKVNTTLVQKNDVNSKEEEKTKQNREATILKALMSQENPVTQEQLREAVILKPLKFTKGSQEIVRKLPNILPKPPPSPAVVKCPEIPLYTSSQNPGMVEAPPVSLPILPTTMESESSVPIPALEMMSPGKENTRDGGIQDINEKKEEEDFSEESSDFEINDEAGYADDESETLFIDDKTCDGKETSNRENVVRCKLYRDNKKMEQRNSENELSDLEIKHRQLRAREDFLDKSIGTLQKFYINLIKNKNNSDCPCDSEETHEIESLSSAEDIRF